ncbi:hypothetical protein RYH80_11270 [Halobaculum sp. MBLA0147]|uniref:hypothetical protein n=1 Tax=Halobaculum sp. MBLA0147 TaxID=3079934 RepID=UPI00352401D1
MTVGIAAICRSEGDDTVVVASDRMVTVGTQGGIEFEDTESKIQVLNSGDDCSVVAVGAGSSTYVDEILGRYDRLVEAAAEPPTTVPAVRRFLRRAYEDRVQESIENQIVGPYGYELDDLRDPNVSVPQSLEQRLKTEVKQAVERLSTQAQILVAGVDQSGGRIYIVSGNDYDEFTNVGYAVVGSGSGSARLTFIRRRYDHTCGYREGVFTVLEAKDQAEERQGVGSRSDLVAVNQSGVSPFDQHERTELENEIANIRAEERRVREDIITDWRPN